MTQSQARTPKGERCRWCRRVLERRSGPGRPREFCSQRCRQWDWVSRQRAADLALGTDEIVISRVELDRLHDDLYMLACAVEDTDRDLAERAPLSNRELQAALDWLLQSARPLRDRELSAASPPPDKTS
ncbi:hypothetical protein [Ilumatobacter nonamiensis]|uniref:hypothetical protein n=1 Tax=Ilumatobacter nonamiensis TaxID=467093 RepID=UPI0011D2A231|nr:hypothetical protein [Ilumatobacter nonamiensis]